MAENEDTAIPETTTTTVGERLRAAREEKGLSLEDVATQTRIPRRHLEAIEQADWERLPAPTYTIGFAKSYATAVGLDRNEVGDGVRDEMGGTRPATPAAEVFEPVDPARTMPKWLVISALAAVVLVVIAMTWLNERSLEPQPAPAVEGAQTTPAVPPPVQRQTPPPAQGPVVLTATDRVWLRVYERDGPTLFEAELGDGQRYQVPATATAPLLRTGKPQALRITVGGQVAPPVGPPERTVSDVSLLPADLLERGGGPTAPGPGASPAPQNSAG